MRPSENELRQACAQCRTEVPPDWQFCAHCETRLQTACARCGVPLPPAGSLRCGHCGLVLASIEIHDGASSRTVVGD